MEDENNLAQDAKTETVENESSPPETETESFENEKLQTVAETRCPNCQALLDKDLAFCPECGNPLKILCQRCGAELQKRQAFCTKCGQKNTSWTVEATPSIEQFNQNITVGGNMTNKKKNFLPFLCVVVAVAVIISYSVFRNMKATEYKENAKTFCTTVLSSSAKLESIGNEIQNEWHDYIFNHWSKYDSIDEAVAGALSNKSDEISKAKAEKKAIDDLYLKLKKPVNRSDEIEDLREAVKVLYDEYEDFYDFVTTPTGNYNSFESKFSELDHSIADAYDDLKDLCDDLN